MERIKELNRYPKGILVLLIVMVLVFTVVYFIGFSKIGFVHLDTFLEKRSDGDDTVYAGSVDGETLTYTVTKDNAVICRYGDKTYGPYTARKDPTAVPKDNDRGEDMVGVEIRKGEEILFRGGVLINKKDMRLFHEKTGALLADIAVSAGGGITDGSAGNIIEPMEPSAYMVLRLLDGPKLIKGGNFWSWLGGMLVAAMTALVILFAEELFRFRMSFRVRDVELTEPSEWEIMSRYAGWTLGTAATLIIFFSGLTMYI